MLHYAIQFFYFLILLEKSYAVAPLKEMYTWTSLDWEFSSESERNEAIDSKMFIPGNGLAAGVVRWRNTVFITAPRWKLGIPATLNTVSLNKQNTSTSPLLRPYPNWEWHLNLEQCEGIVSVYRLALDNMNRLWVTDNGLSNRERLCPIQLLVFDLTSNQLIIRETFPSSVLSLDSQLVSVVVESDVKTKSTYAYFADQAARALIVYDVKRNKFWRHKHNYFHPDPFAGDFTIAGTRVQFMDGIFGLALSPIKRDSERYLFFNPLASYRVFAVPTRLLHNETNLQSNFDEFYYTVAKPSQSAMIAMDKNGVLFYGLLTLTSVGCWFWKYPFQKKFQTEIDRNPVTLQYVSDITIDDKDNLFVLTNKLPKFITGTIDQNDVNFRVLTVPIQATTQGTVCEADNLQTKTNCCTWWKSRYI